MGSPARTQARRQSAAEKRKAAAAARKRGKPKTGDATELTAEEKAAAEGIKDGVFVAIVRAEDGKDINGIVPVPQGDLRASEMLHILKKAVKLIEQGI